MKKRITLAFLAFLLIFSAKFSLVVTSQDVEKENEENLGIVYTGYERIERFHSKIEILPSGKVIVEESIDYNFGYLEKHGIIRWIPVLYKNSSGKKFDIRFKLEGVEKDGEKVPFKFMKRGGYIVLKIGDPKKYVSGIANYKIKYQVERVVNRFEHFNEIFWEVTGHDSDVSIVSASAEVNLPKKGSFLKADCFSGYMGSKEKNCSYENFDGKTIFFKLDDTKSLYPNEGFSIVLGFDKEVLDEEKMNPIMAIFGQRKSEKETIKDFKWEEISSEELGNLASETNLKVYDLKKLDHTIWFLQKFGIGIFSLLLFGIGFFLKWKKYGKDTKKSMVIAPNFRRPDIPPAEAGVLIDEKVDSIDINVTIIDLAARGFIRIKEISTKNEKMDYEFQLLKSKDSNELSEFEKMLLDKIFGKNELVKLSELENKFYKYLPTLKNTLYRSVVKLGLFGKEPDYVRDINVIFSLIPLLFYISLPIGGGFLFGYSSIFVLIFLVFSYFSIFCFGKKVFIFIILLPFFTAVTYLAKETRFSINYPDPFFTSICFLFVILFAIIFSIFSPKKTKKGVLVEEDLLGLKKYFEMVEKKNNENIDLPKLTEKLFDDLLPYAFILGVQAKWAKAFSDIYKKPPEWYESSSFNNKFTILNFLISIDKMNKAASSTLSSIPAESSGTSSSRGWSGFSSGGSSGGGFGGGGVGSW